MRFDLLVESKIRRPRRMYIDTSDEIRTCTDLINAIRNATASYVVNTPNAYARIHDEGISVDFVYFMNEIPNEFLKNFGLRKVMEEAEFVMIDGDKSLINGTV